MDIAKKIMDLPMKDFLRFERVLNESLANKLWCMENGIIYGHPDITKAKERVYQQFYRD